MPGQGGRNRKAALARGDLAIPCQNMFEHGPRFTKRSWQEAKADSTLRSSQAVPQPSTDRALRRYTSEVERYPVHSTWYGHQRTLTHKQFTACAGRGCQGWAGLGWAFWPPPDTENPSGHRQQLRISSGSLGPPPGGDLQSPLATAINALATTSS